MTISAIVLDLDGVIVDTEEIWDRERRAYVEAHGGTWTDAATRTMQWSAYLRDELGDSSNGLRAAHAAGMIVIATPNHAFPPAPDALGLAAVVVDGIKDVTPEVVASL